MDAKNYSYAGNCSPVVFAAGCDLDVAGDVDAGRYGGCHVAGVGGGSALVVGDAVDAVGNHRAVHRDAAGQEEVAAAVAADTLLVAAIDVVGVVGEEEAHDCSARAGVAVAACWVEEAPHGCVQQTDCARRNPVAAARDFVDCLPCVSLEQAPLLPTV